MSSRSTARMSFTTRTAPMTHRMVCVEAISSLHELTTNMSCDYFRRGVAGPLIAPACSQLADALDV